MHILIIEDHQDFRQAVKGFLADHLKTVQLLESGTAEDALGLMAQFRPGIVILDILLPDTNGILVADKIKQLYPRTKIIVLTILESEALYLSLRKRGVAGYIPKCQIYERLLPAIMNIIERFGGRGAPLQGAGRVHSGYSDQKGGGS